MSYQVALDTFHGPLDLLLYLVKKNEVDVLDIPIAKLTDQFLETMKVLPAIDVELAGDFLVMAATLMEIKSRSLLPAEAAAGEGDEPDPRRELVRQLLEYRKFKDAAAALQKQAEAQRRPAAADPAGRAGGGRGAGRPPGRAVGPGQRVRPADAGDAGPAAGDHRRGRHPAARLRGPGAEPGGGRAAGGVPGRVRPAAHQPRLIGLFLAVLELIKRTEVWLEQPEPFGDIWLLAPGHPS